MRSAVYMLLLALCFAYIVFCKASTTEDPDAEGGTTDDDDNGGEDSGTALMANAILISLGIIASRFY